MIIIAVASVVLLSVVGGLAYSNQRANAKEATAKQALIASVDAQHTKEDVAKLAKAGDPVVSEEYPARIIPDATVPPTGSTTTTQTATPTNGQTAQASTTTTDTTKQAQQQSPTHANVAPKPATIPSSAKAANPPATPVPVSQPAKAITSLSNADIQRLQSYAPYLGTGGELYTSFHDMYANDKEDCEALMAKFSATTLNDYNQAKTEWLTSPKLVYTSILCQYCVRGIVSVTYYGNNKFGLTPNVKYQREVEYRLRNSVTNGAMTLKLETINYLTGFKAVN